MTAVTLLLLSTLSAHAANTSLEHCRIMSMGQTDGNDSLFGIDCEAREGKFETCYIQAKATESLTVSKARLYRDGENETATVSHKNLTLPIRDLWQASACGGVAANYAIWKKEALPPMKTLLGKHAEFDDRNPLCRVDFDTTLPSGENARSWEYSPRGNVSCRNEDVAMTGYGDFSPIEFINPKTRTEKIVLSRCSLAITGKAVDEVVMTCSMAQKRSLNGKGTIVSRKVKFGSVDFPPLVCQGISRTLDWGTAPCKERIAKSLAAPYEDIRTKLDAIPENR